VWEVCALLSPSSIFSVYRWTVSTFLQFRLILLFLFLVC